VGFVGGGLVLASAVIGLIGLLVHRAVGRRPMAGAPPGVTFRTQGDGFWLHAPPHLHGSMLHYRCLVKGAIRRASVPIEPGPRGQFVYTGGVPSAVEVEQIGAAAWAAPRAAGWAAAPSAAPRAAAAGAAGRRSRDRISSAPDVAVAAPFRGYPSAY
jgi:hypothetical protein